MLIEDATANELEQMVAAIPPRLAVELHPLGEGRAADEFVFMGHRGRS
jgi:hypothetical protein